MQTGTRNFGKFYNRKWIIVIVLECLLLAGIVYLGTHKHSQLRAILRATIGHLSGQRPLPISNTPRTVQEFNDEMKKIIERSAPDDSDRAEEKIRDAAEAPTIGEKVEEEKGVVDTPTPKE